MVSCASGNEEIVKCLLESKKVDAAHVNAKAQVMMCRSFSVESIVNLYII